MKVLSLFSGIGGLDLAAEWAGMEVVAQCEIDPFCQSVLKRHWPHVRLIDDIQHLQDIIPADVICGGFPCQDVSTSGRRAGIAGSRSGLWRWMVRAIRLVRPQYVVVENVAGLLNRGMGRVLGDLAESGHDTQWGCLSACEFGAPHARERVFIIAHPPGVRLQGPWERGEPMHPTPDAFREAGGLVHAVQGEALPYVCRGHDGIPNGLGEAALHALGNAVVPAQAYPIFKAIMEAA